MLGWLRNLSGKRLPPLTGAPTTRRLKTYSAGSGYVYQYFYEGQRPVRRGADPGTQFVFQVSSDRQTYTAASVFLSAAAILSWEGVHGRDLHPTERYAVAKMALVQAFDERTHPAQMADEVSIRPADLEAFLETLGID